MVCAVFALLSKWAIVLPLLRRSASALNLSMIAIGVAMKFDTAAMMLFGKESLAVASF